MTEYKIKVLVTLDSREEEIRTFSVEAWNTDQAIKSAEQQALLDDEVVEAVTQLR